VNAIWRAVRSFVRFWRDFLIGDAPELFIGVLVFVGVAFALHRHGGIAAAVLPLMVVALLAGSVFAGRARS
jgi:hypothetical protein